MRDTRIVGYKFEANIISMQKHKSDKFDILIKMLKQEQDKKKAKQDEKIQEVH